MRAIGNLEGKMNLILESADKRDGRYDAHGKRIASLEASRDTAKGVQAALAGMAALAVSGAFWPHITKWFGGQ